MILTDIEIPAGMTPDEIPKSMRLKNEQKDIIMTRSTDYNESDHLIRAMIKIEFTRSLYQADEYEVLQLFYKKLFEYMDEQVLLKKK